MSNAPGDKATRTPSDDALTDPQAAASAFERVKPALAKLDPKAYRRLNVNVLEACRLVLGRLDGILALRPRVREELPQFPIEHFDQLRDRVLAVIHAHREVVGASRAGAELDALLAEAQPLREKLLAWGDTLVRWEIFEEDAIAAIRKGSGYTDLADDLGKLAVLYQRGGNAITGKTRVTEAEIERALVLGQTLLKVLGSRDGQPAADEAQVALRRAFTLLINSYEEVRRAIGYLRFHEGDADEIAPSLFVVRRRGRRASAAGDEVELAPGQPPGAPGAAPSSGPLTPAASGTAAGGSSGNGLPS